MPTASSGLPSASLRLRMPASECASSSLRWAATPTSSSSWPPRSLRPPIRARWTCLLSSGERISMALLSMAINELGQGCRFVHRFAGGDRHRLRPREGPHRRRQSETCSRGTRDANRIVIVAGFQGVSTDFDVTTLGRGGSDTSAVALAAALGADACEIYTDVRRCFHRGPSARSRRAQAPRGVVTRRCSSCLRAGAKVLMLRSVEYARNHGVLIHVRSSFDPEEGTWVREEDARMEQAIISAIAHDTSEAKVTIQGGSRSPRCRGSRFPSPRGRERQHRHDRPEFVAKTAPRTSSSRFPRTTSSGREPVLDQIAKDVGAQGIETDSDIAKISLVGAGMKTHPGVAADMFDALADAGINIEIISTSSIRISCVIRCR